MYWHVTPPGENIQVVVKKIDVNDVVPYEEYIEWSVKRLCSKQYRGSSCMKVEQMKQWLDDTQDKDCVDGTHWKKALEIIQTS